MGVRREWLARVADLAMEDHCTPTNARTPTAADYRDMLDEAM
jgi:alcohol dehydrogenase class IV